MTVRKLDSLCRAIVRTNQTDKFGLDVAYEADYDGATMMNGKLEVRLSASGTPILDIYRNDGMGSPRGRWHSDSVINAELKFYDDGRVELYVQSNGGNLTIS